MIYEFTNLQINEFKIFSFYFLVFTSRVGSRPNFLVLSSYFLLLFASGSEGRAKAERRHSVKTNPRLAISRPFSNAKIVRNYDITNFSSKKKSLFPLLKKRGSLWYQKRLSLAARDIEGVAIQIV